MGMFLRATKVSENSDRVVYWIASGLDNAMGEMTVIVKNDWDASYTKGFQGLCPWSSEIVGKIAQGFISSGVWPQETLLES